MNLFTNTHFCFRPGSIQYNSRIISLIILNLTVLIVIAGKLFSDQELDLSKDHIWLAIIALGNVTNLFTCAVLGEEISNDGFKAIIWTVFFSYLFFLILGVRYAFYLASPKRKTVNNKRNELAIRLLENVIR